MRMKRSVDFWMAPKKSSKGKSATAKPTREEGWNMSKCSESDLETLVSAGLLVPRSIIQWRPALGKDHPYENTGEIVAFTLFGTRIGVSFFVFLLWAPAHLCEAFLGIESHFELFRCLFHLKPQPDSFVLDVVGGAGLQLCRGRIECIFLIVLAVK